MLAPMANNDDADALRTVPPGEFVRARTALAARLEQKGKSAEARQIRRLRRPSPIVWALNMAATRPRAIDELADAADRLRRAQLGQGDLRPAIERYRAALEPVIRAAAERLREAGVRISPTIERRLQATLLAAVTDRRLRAELATGRLTEEHAEPGFEVLTRGPIPAEFLRARRGIARTPSAHAQPSTAQPPPEEPETPRRDPVKAERHRQDKEHTTRKVTRQTQRQLKALDKAARRQERAADAADRKVQELRTALHKRERQAKLLRTSANEARQVHQTALKQGRTGSEEPKAQG
jgi:hypothetical protein